MQNKVKIIFKDSTQAHYYDYDDLYIKSECLCIRNGNEVTKYPLIHIHSFTHPY